VNGYRLGLMHGALLVAIVLVVWVVAHAQVSVSVFGLSKHSESGYCEVNPGLGVNYQLTENFRFGVARLRISPCRPSNWIGFVYDPLKIGNFRFGVAFLRVTSYQPEPVYVPLPVGSYVVSRHHAVDFFAAHKGGTSVTGAAYRYSF
jgi:hypothetical protein